jgi:hypothetical protein
LLRKFLKNKAGLPVSTNNFLLEDKMMGLGVKRFRGIHNSQLISIDKDEMSEEEDDYWNVG